MPYAFEFRAWDMKQPDEDDRYGDTTKNEVNVTVVAEDEQDAEVSVKTLVTREKYKLSNIVELSEDLMPIKSS